MNGQIKTDAQVQEELASLRCRVDELDRANRQLRQEIAEQQETMSDLRRRVLMARLTERFADRFLGARSQRAVDHRK